MLTVFVLKSHTELLAEEVNKEQIIGCDIVLNWKTIRCSEAEEERCLICI